MIHASSLVYQWTDTKLSFSAFCDYLISFRNRLIRIALNYYRIDLNILSYHSTGWAQLQPIKRQEAGSSRNIAGEWEEAVWAGVVGTEQQWLRWRLDGGDTIKSTTVSLQWFSWQLKQTNKQTFTVCMFLCVWCGTRDKMCSFDVIIKLNCVLFIHTQVPVFFFFLSLHVHMQTIIYCIYLSG